MAIRASSARDVDALIGHLHSAQASDRDAAVARLRVIGPRALARVLAVIDDLNSPRDVRIAALKVVEASDDARVKRHVLTLIRDGEPDVAAAALNATRTWLTDDPDTDVLDAVTSVLADAACPMTVRQAALDALSDVPDHITQPLVDAVGPLLAATPPQRDAAAAADWLAGHQDAAPGVLHDLIMAARDQEREASDQVNRLAWLRVRAAAHEALARRNSRVALHDIRESLEQAPGPLPLEFLTALGKVGDVSCLEALARAWDAAGAEESWRGQLQQTALAVMRTNKATGRHAAVKRVRTKWPGFLQ